MKEKSYERGIDVTVRDLRECLEGLPDDMEVIIPVHDYAEYNKVLGLRHARAIGVLKSPYEKKPALCIAATADGADMYTLMDLYEGDVECINGLF